MARDRGLEDLLRDSLRGERGLTEKSMFGGWAWLLDGRLLCGARDDGMLVRLGAGRDAWALALPDVAPMMMRGRAMSGWVRAGPAAYGDDRLRARLIAEGLAFVQALPSQETGRAARSPARSRRG